MSMNELNAAHEHFSIAIKTNSPNKIFNILSIIIIGIRQHRTEQYDISPDDINNIPLKAAYHISCGLSAFARSDMDEAK